jgi:hypothetical protein
MFWYLRTIYLVRFEIIHQDQAQVLVVSADGLERILVSKIWKREPDWLQDEVDTCIAMQILSLPYYVPYCISFRLWVCSNIMMEEYCFSLASAQVLFLSKMLRIPCDILIYTFCLSSFSKYFWFGSFLSPSPLAIMMETSKTWSKGVFADIFLNRLVLFCLFFSKSF